MALPDFLIVGSPKAGSTALHDALALHPRLYLSNPKEPKFFLGDGTRPDRAHHRGPGDAHSAREWVWNQSRYERLFSHAPQGALSGESTPFYLWDRQAHQRIHKLIPDVKMIAVIRDPVDRAYSNWTHMWCDGLEPESNFLRACELETERVKAGYAPFWRYLEIGLYGKQLEHLYKVFPTEQVFVLRYRQLVDDTQAVLDEICRFLEVETGVISGAPRSNVSTWAPDSPVNRVLQKIMRAGAVAGSWAPPKIWRQVQRPLLAALHRGRLQRPKLAVEDRRRLLPYFAEDARLLESLTGTSFADWQNEVGRGAFSERKS